MNTILAAEKLRTFIRAHQPGRCRVLTSNCDCPLCCVDALVETLQRKQVILERTRADNIYPAVALLPVELDHVLDMLQSDVWCFRDPERWSRHARLIDLFQAARNRDPA